MQRSLICSSIRALHSTDSTSFRLRVLLALKISIISREPEDVDAKYETQFNFRYNFSGLLLDKCKQEMRVNN